MGQYKRANIAALRQAKFYPPQQAAAAADRALRLPQCTRWNDLLPQCTSRNARDGMFISFIGAHALRRQNLKVALTQCMRWNAVHPVYCGSCITAVPQLALKCRNISPFMRSL